MEAAFQSGFASALLDILFNKVTDVVIVELRKIIGSDAALGKLQTTVLQAQKLLNQVDTFEMQGIIKNIMQQKVDTLTDLCYSTEDMMDDIFHMIPDKHHSSFYDKSVLKAILPSPRNWSKPRNILKLQNKLDAILTELEALVELAVHPESETAGVSNGHRMPNIEMSLPLRNNDVGDIVQELVSRNSKCHGVSIVGIDGLGKTTVALHVRDEALISTNFASRLWVDVLGCFNAEHIIQQLDQLHSTDSSSNNAEDKLQSILIIFDNLLEVKLVEWNVFWSHVVTKGINGRRYKNIKFLITTFNPRVARNTRTSSHYLKPLSDENCEKVIMATAKSHNQHLSGMHFQHAASLAKKCGGLPSVASILGVVLAQYNADDVHNILNEDLWDSILFKEEVLPALKSCYAKIQSQLKRCLAYFSLFPHNYSFTVDELVQLWIGEGFFQETQGARDHFTDLLGMSILRLSDQMSPSGMPKYELNAFGHKFAQLAASRTCLRLVQGLPPSNSNTRHLSYRDHIGFPVWDNLKKLKGLRTFLSVCKTSINPIIPACPIPACAFKTLTRLRVLSLSQTDVSKLPDSISYLKHLHYLDVSRTAIKTLPETLSELHTLQFLKLVKDKGNLEYLPKHFQNLTKLLYIDWEISDIRHMGLPTSIGHLTSLQTLPLFPIGDKAGHFITELQNMNQLQGSIRISNLEKVQDWAMAKGAMLSEKPFIKALELEWMASKRHNVAKQVLSCLKPHQHLKQLKITNYPGDAFPEWMIHSLPELEELHLNNCSGIKVLSKLGLLPSLKVLVFQEMSNVVNLDHQFFGPGHFLKLESLMFNQMEQLQEVTVGSESNAMPCLHSLTLIDCEMLINMTSLDNLSSLVELHIETCGSLSSLPNLPTSLESLTIRDSELLSTCCSQGGDDWPRVDSITNVEIDYEKIPTFGSASLPKPLDHQEEDFTSPGMAIGQQNEGFVWRGYRLFKDGTGAMVRWCGLKI